MWIHRRERLAGADADMNDQVIDGVREYFDFLMRFEGD